MLVEWPEGGGIIGHLIDTCCYLPGWGVHAAAPPSPPHDGLGLAEGLTVAGPAVYVRKTVSQYLPCSSSAGAAGDVESRALTAQARAGRG
ncbi:predicted protein [Plenodomus lingam JN3]|uniref:Predicted protein n=1 Tax=Leptosphaeria maculans (strain JN3 / isolate v23.1.3 / race Av1-4-5-6-7-8) TaxID=985895 RepID=E4ZN57_LEPMJ|nr:predicted protein [Plenodomus lingam JN3]CBX92660.1 predicted protein [Plenodomus lingam JN3]